MPFGSNRSWLTSPQVGQGTLTATGEYNLKSNDFLSMDEYPQLTFTSTEIKQTGETSFDVTGDLTIKDVTRSVTVPFEFEGSAKQIAELRVDP